MDSSIIHSEIVRPTSTVNNVDGGISFKHYLEMGVQELPTDFPLQKAILWVDHCINNFYKNHAPTKIFNLLAKLLIIYSRSQDFKNSVSNKIPKIISLCISASTKDAESSLECLEIILLKYGNSSFLSKAKISVYLERFLCSPLNVQVITKAGNALHLIQQIGGAGKNGTIHKKQWLDYVQVLCKTMDTLYDIFFDNIKEFSTNTNSSTNIAAYDIVLQAHSDNKQIALKLRNVAIFLKCALLKQYPVERSIPFHSLFQVIKRGLTVDEYSDISIQTDEFLSLLYKLQINLLYLLKVVVICGSPGIRTHSEEILKLLTDCLKRTDKQYFTDKSEYQTALYGILNKYIILEKENLSSVACDTILSHNLKYILCVSTPPVGSNTQEEISMQLSPLNQNQISTVINVKCMEAIHTAINLVRNAVLINENKLDVLYNFAKDNLVNIRNGRSKQPYPKFTADLFMFVNVLRTMPNYCSLPLINLTLEMINTDWRNKNDPTCLQELVAMENLVNPMYPSLTIRNFNSGSVGSDRNIFLENEAYARNINNIISTNFVSLPVNGNIHSDRNSKVDVHKDISKKTTSSSINSDIIDDEPAKKLLRIDNSDDAALDHVIINNDTVATNIDNEQNDSILMNDVSSDQNGIGNDNSYIEPTHPEQVLLEGSDVQFTHESNAKPTINELYEMNKSSIIDSEQISEKRNNEGSVDAVKSEIISLINEKDNIKKEDTTPNASFVESDEDDIQLFKDVPNSQFNFE